MLRHQLTFLSGVNPGRFALWTASLGLGLSKLARLAGGIDASRQRGRPGRELIDWKSETCSTRAVREYLAALEENNPSGPSRSSH